MVLANSGEMEAYLVTRYCKVSKVMIDAMPSIIGTFFKMIVLAPIEPIITVTTQSKLFSCEVERLPDTLCNNTMQTYTTAAEITILTRVCRLSKNNISITYEVSFSL